MIIIIRLGQVVIIVIVQCDRIDYDVLVVLGRFTKGHDLSRPLLDGTFVRHGQMRPFAAAAAAANDGFGRLQRDFRHTFVDNQFFQLFSRHFILV